MLYKIKTFIRRFLSSSLDLNRPANFPYISGDNFKAISDHVLDEVSDIRPSEVYKGDVVFVRGNHLDEFFQIKHPLISEPYILIVHNDDAATSERHMHFLEGGKIIHLFAANLLFTHPKATALPVGINSRRYDRDNITVRAIDSYSKNIDRVSKILFGFNIRTNFKVRIPILKILKEAPLAETTEERVDKKTYLKLISKYKTIASPPGNGFDCLRTWEALYLKTIPIVEKSPAIESFKEAGIPLHIIDSWETLRTITEQEISDIFEKLSPGFNCGALWMPYWLGKIEKVRTDFRS